MEISVKKLIFQEIKEEVVGIPLVKGESLPKEFSEFADSIRKGEFDGSEGQILPINTREMAKFSRLLLIGIGEAKEVSPELFRRAAGSLVRYAKASKCTATAILVPPRFSRDDFVQALAEGAVLADYKFLKFKTKQDNVAVDIRELVIVADTKLSPAAKKGKLLAEAQNYVRKINEHPANMATPQKLAELARTLAKEKKLAVTVYEKDDLKKMGMNGILAVNQGSDLPPVLVILEYNKDKKSLPLYCVVGKGVTFDSGGISIKPSKGMQEMKYDKSGAVDVLGITKAVAELNLPIRLLGIFPATENMPSGSAQKPGDIVTAYNGKTMEVLNTDAEGRLILADALAFAAEKKPEAIIDLATLTGAIIVCLGPHAIGLFSNDDELSKAIENAGENTFERVWRMPIWKEYGEMIKGDFADIKNIGSESGEAGSITASKFLQEFVGECKWAHLDIAGVDLIRASHPYLEKGASGMGVRLVVSALEIIASKGLAGKMAGKD